MKSSWIGIGFSHHRVPSLSNTATRSSTGTASAPSQVRATKSTIACFAAPSRQAASAVGFDEPTVSVSGTTDKDLGWPSRAGHHPRGMKNVGSVPEPLLEIDRDGYDCHSPSHVRHRRFV